MVKPTYFTLFSGGDGAGIGLQAAGYRHLGGVEYDPAIAAVAASNGHPLTVADVRAVDPLSYAHGAPTWLHASPVCKNASQAKTDGAEDTTDIETAQAVCRFIRAWSPPTVSVENVWQYRTFQAFKAITDCLTECGYSFEYWHLCAADYGVPQTRRRLILVARRGLYYIQRPTATHQEVGDWFSPPWVGWYEAIEDLIPTLPASRFADWQLARLPEQMTQFLMAGGGNTNLQEAYPGRGCRAVIEPAHTVCTITSEGGSMPRAFILDCQNAGDANQDRGIALRADVEPMYTLSASTEKRPARAFLVEGSAAGLDNPYPLQMRSDNEPVFTMRARQNNPRAFLVDCVHRTDADLTVRDEAEPAHTITATAYRRPGNVARAWLSAGRVVSMTPQALARFQSIPDWYVLPEKNALACTIIGNAVCPLLMQRVAESIK